MRAATLSPHPLPAGASTSLDELGAGTESFGHFIRRISMVRTVLSLVVLSCLLCAFPSTSIAGQSKAAAATAAKPSTAIVNLNTASASDLEGLPGIGAKT